MLPLEKTLRFNDGWTDWNGLHVVHEGFRFPRRSTRDVVEVAWGFFRVGCGGSPFQFKEGSRHVDWGTFSLTYFRFV